MLKLRKNINRNYFRSYVGNGYNNLPENFDDLLGRKFIYYMIFKIEYKNADDFDAVLSSYPNAIYYTDNVITSWGNVATTAEVKLYMEEEPDEVWLKLACGDSPSFIEEFEEDMLLGLLRRYYEEEE